MIMHAKTVKFCMIFTASNFNSDRGECVVKQLTTLSRMLNNNGHRSLPEMMTPLLVREEGLTPKELTSKMTNME